MKKTLLILTILFSYQFANCQTTKCEQIIVESYKKEFMARALAINNRKVKTGKNDFGKKVSFISYIQLETNPNGPDNIKEIVLTNYKDKIPEFTFNYGSEAYEYGEKYMEHPTYKKGKQYYHLSSKNILNKDCKAVYFENIYQLIVVNPYDKEVLNIDLEVELNVSASVWHNFKEIEKEYNKQYTYRTIEELKKVGVDVNGVNTEVALRMVMIEREAIINRILLKYNSSIHFNFRTYIARPSQIWDQFYVDPIKFIKIIFENSHNLSEE